MRLECIECVSREDNVAMIHVAYRDVAPLSSKEVCDFRSFLAEAVRPRS